MKPSRDRLAALGIGGGAAFWDAVQAEPHQALPTPRALVERGARGRSRRRSRTPTFAAQAAALLPPEPWDETTWGAWTKAASPPPPARKGRALFHPLRLALTGREHGPELKKLLPLIGRAKALARLKGETA